MFKKINGGSSVLKATAKDVKTNTIEFMVNTAIMSLDNPRGSTVAAIIKEVSKMYDTDGDALYRAIKRYLNLTDGLDRTTGFGSEDTFKLSYESSKKIERQIKAAEATMSKAKKIPEAEGSKIIAAVKNAPSTPAAVGVKKVPASTPNLYATPVKEPTKDPEIGPMKPVPKKTVSSAPATASTSAASKTLQLNTKKESWIPGEDSEDSIVSGRDWYGVKNNTIVKSVPKIRSSWMDTPDAMTKNVGDNQNCICYQTGGKLIEKSSGEPPRFKIERREIITSVVLDGRSMESMKSLHQFF